MCVVILELYYSILLVDDDYNTDVSEDSEEDEDETESTDADCSLADSGYCDNSSPPLSHESRYLCVYMFFSSILYVTLFCM